MTEQKPKDEQSRDENPTTPFARFEELAKKILAVSKEELDEKRAEHEWNGEEKGWEAPGEARDLSLAPPASYRPRSCAGGAVNLLGGDEPLLLVHWPATVGLLHLGFGCVHPTDLVSLADFHL